MKVKVTSGEADNDGGFFLFTLLVGDHALERLPLPPGFKGISAEFVTDVDTGLAKGWTPKRIVSQLIIACGANEAKKLRVPTIDKIAARRSTMTSSPQFKFEKVADMLLYVNEPGRLVTTRAMFDAIDNYDQLLVYSTFFYDTTVKDDSPGAGRRHGASENFRLQLRNQATTLTAGPGVLKSNCGKLDAAECFIGRGLLKNACCLF